jgi:hypothetical protein
MIETIPQGTLPTGCKACIALTSWKKRITTVGTTIFNLLHICGTQYHIVLTLSEDEFPSKEHDLPHDLVLMNKAHLFEILWVKKNYKAFKKWIFCSMKYPNVPIISADDDCIYLNNYAEILYAAWLKNKNNVISNEPNIKLSIELPCGCGTLYPPRQKLRNAIEVVLTKPNIVELNNDDMCIGYILKKLNISISYAFTGYPLFHDDNDGGNYDSNEAMYNALLSLFP